MGPQGELILIDALTQDIHPVIRSQAAIGLGILTLFIFKAELGLRNLRTLLIGLNDESVMVIRTVEQAIVKNISIEQVHSNLSELLPHRLSFKINIKSILESNKIQSHELRKLLSEILNLLDRQTSTNNFNVKSESGSN